MNVGCLKWEPEAPIQAALEAAGATLVVLDMADAGIVEDGRLTADGYQRILRRNLDTLYTALAAANER